MNWTKHRAVMKKFTPAYEWLTSTVRNNAHIWLAIGLHGEFSRMDQKCTFTRVLQAQTSL